MVADAAPLARSRTTPRATTVILVAVLIAATGYFLVPVYWLFVSATKSTADLYGSNGFALARVQLWQNIVDVLTFQDSAFVRWAANSVLYAGVGALVATIIAASTGYAVAKFRWRGRDAFFTVILAGVLVPSTVLTLPLFFLFSAVGLTNTVWAIFLPSIVSPFGVFLCRIYAEASVPTELMEAARLDGAGEVRIFLSLVLRILTPALITVALFQFVGIWNNYFLPLVMLSDSHLYPITLGLTAWQSYATREPGLGQLALVGSALSVVPLMIAMVVLQRFWRSGLTTGGVKG